MSIRKAPAVVKNTQTDWRERTLIFAGIVIAGLVVALSIALRAQTPPPEPRSVRGRAGTLSEQ